MKKAIYDYIAEHPHTTIGQCATALKIFYSRATDLIQALCQEGLVAEIIVPRESGILPGNDVFYTVCRPYWKKGQVTNETFANSTGKLKQMRELDILGNAVSVGDTIIVIAHDGRYLTTEVVNSCSESRCYFDNHKMFAYQDAYRTNEALFSVTAIREQVNNLDLAGSSRRDALGNEISVGDSVLLIMTGCHKFQIGKVISLAGKSCLIEYPKDCYGKTTGRRFYRDIVSLSKLNINTVRI